MTLDQPEQNALEARHLPDQDQIFIFRKPDGLPATNAAVIQAIRVDEEEAMPVADADFLLASFTLRDGTLNQRQRISTPQPRAIKMNVFPALILKPGAKTNLGLAFTGDEDPRPDLANHAHR